MLVLMAERERTVYPTDGGDPYTYRSTIPIVHALVSSKETETYMRFFQLVKEVCDLKESG
jgi:hypothetical protein